MVGHCRMGNCTVGRIVANTADPLSTRTAVTMSVLIVFFFFIIVWVSCVARNNERRGFSFLPGPRNSPIATLPPRVVNENVLESFRIPSAPAVRGHATSPRYPSTSPFSAHNELVRDWLSKLSVPTPAYRSDSAVARVHERHSVRDLNLANEAWSGRHTRSNPSSSSSTVVNDEVNDSSPSTLEGASSAHRLSPVPANIEGVGPA